MTTGVPQGTRFVTQASARAREAALVKLQTLYAGWGYQPVEVPALERFDPEHPRADQSFKLVDHDSAVLALRADFTPALAQLVRTHHPELTTDTAGRPLRLRYAGTVWHAIHSELAREREFTQVGVELIGVSNARADAEIIHLARESVRAVGLTPRVELGNPAYVRALFDAAGLQPEQHAPLADAIDRKDRSELLELLGAFQLRGRAADAILQTPDLYGDSTVLAEARRLAPSDGAHAALDRLEGVLEQFEDVSELLLDLGLARRLSYYTGVTFRTFTFDYGQPLLGGGRYDGALLPYAAGFSIGLERLLSALPPAGEQAPEVLALDDPPARALRAAGVVVARALGADEAAAEREAKQEGVPFLLTAAGLRPVAAAGHDAERLAQLRQLLSGAVDE